MAALQERYELNPKVISPEAVGAVVADLLGEPSTYLQALQAKRIKGTHFEEIIHPAFQVLRIRALGFEIPITDEDRARYGLTIENISNFGREDVQMPKDEDIGWDSVESINVMRAFVVSTFCEEAARQGLPTPVINERLIDPPPAKKHQIDGAEASKPGMFLYNWDELEERWAGENPALFQETVQLKDKLTDYYTRRMLAVYFDLPAEYMDKISPEVRSTYNDYLMAYAVRTYAMLTPNPPTLIEIKNIQV